MKIRMGFVSNSSSSSFLAYGAYVDSKELKKVYKNFFNEENVVEDEDDYEIVEKICKSLGSGFGYWNCPDSNDYVIGKSWDDVGDDETGLQFKTTIHNALKQVFGDKIKVETHQEAWFDG